MDLNFLLSVFVWFGGSATIATLIALVVDVLKRFGVIKDGMAGRWAAGLNLLALAGFSVFFYFNPAVDFSSVSESLVNVLAIINFVLGFALQLFVSPAVHNAAGLANLPLLGYSITDASE